MFTITINHKQWSEYILYVIYTSLILSAFMPPDFCSVQHVNFGCGIAEWIGDLQTWKCRGNIDMALTAAAMRRGLWMDCVIVKSLTAASVLIPSASAAGLLAGPPSRAEPSRPSRVTRSDIGGTKQFWRRNRLKETATTNCVCKWVNG